MNECPGRLSRLTTDENVEEVKEMIMNDHRISIREVVDDVGILFSLRHDIFFECFEYETSDSKMFQNF